MIFRTDVEIVSGHGKTLSSVTLKEMQCSFDKRFLLEIQIFFHSHIDVQQTCLQLQHREFVVLSVQVLVSKSGTLILKSNFEQVACWSHLEMRVL